MRWHRLTAGPGSASSGPVMVVDRGLLTSGVDGNSYDWAAGSGFALAGSYTHMLVCVHGFRNATGTMNFDYVTFAGETLIEFEALQTFNGKWLGDEANYNSRALQGWFIVESSDTAPQLRFSFGGGDTSYYGVAMVWALNNVDYTTTDHVLVSDLEATDTIDRYANGRLFAFGYHTAGGQTLESNAPTIQTPNKLENYHYMGWDFATVDDPASSLAKASNLTFGMPAVTLKP